MSIHIREGDIHQLGIRTRMPFKYGIAVMTSTPHVFVRLRVEIDGAVHAGIAADHLPPKWFTKDPTRAVEDEVIEMRRVIEQSVQSASGMRGDSAFAIWRRLWAAQASWGAAMGFPSLLTQFGTSLVERALIEAICRARGASFAALLNADAFGVSLETVHPRLRGTRPADWLPARPLTRLIARHTVGMVDSLTEDDIAPSDRLADGLPQSLEDCVPTYGLRHFKIKINGDLDHDGARLQRIAAVLESVAPTDYAFSLDGNEQFREAEKFRAYWASLTSIPELSRFFEHLLFVEQPFHRDAALQECAVGALRNWHDRPLMIIDESDGDLLSAAHALQLGYHGTSHKNCKGVFKGVLNACLIASMRLENPATRYIMSGEDLANIGPVALLQDLAVCAALGVGSVERNGHHYFAGLSMFPAEVQRRVLAAHGDLYHASRDGWPTLHIDDGMLHLDSINAAPFGVGFRLDVASLPGAAPRL